MSGKLHHGLITSLFLPRVLSLARKDMFNHCLKENGRLEFIFYITTENHRNNLDL